MKEDGKQIDLALDLNKVTRALFESATEGMVVVDRRGLIRMSNPRMAELFGYAEGELLGESVGILIPITVGTRHGSHFESYFKKPTRRAMGMGIDLLGRKKDGTEIPIEISLNHFEADGASYAMALITDISMRTKAKEALEALNHQLEARVVERTRELLESQKLYNIIARNFPNGTINVFDRNLKYVFVEGKELFRIGVTGDQLIGKSYLERIVPSLRETIKGKLMRVFQGENMSFELGYQGNHYQLNAVGLHNSHREIQQILVVEQNITRQKLAEESMVLALEKERELNELKSRFVSMASHEFRTPLSTILTSLSLLERYTGPEHEEKRNKHFRRIRSGVHNLTGILDDFLSLDKLEEGSFETHSTKFKLKEMLADLLESMQAVAKRTQSLVLSFEGADEVFQDRKLLRNVLINLVSNAIKYSPEGSEILVETKSGKDILLIAVKDKGIGIPKEDQSHMFERFFRAKNASNLEGTGLGLNIVKKYLDLMGGQIRFESELDVGSTFTITLAQK